MTEQVTTSNADGDQQETVESLKARLTEMDTTLKSLSDEATKNKNLRRQAEKERDALKVAKTEVNKSDEDYKNLWSQTTEKLTKAVAKAKDADIKSSLADEFGRAKVAGDKVSAALGLIDRTLIEWDEDAGTDAQSVKAAVQKLKSTYGFLFESTVNPTDVVRPGDGGTKTSITRAAFDALSPLDRVAKLKSGVKLTD